MVAQSEPRPGEAGGAGAGAAEPSTSDADGAAAARGSSAEPEPAETIEPSPADREGSLGFFVTSVGMGRGGDLGGLAGADGHCQRLANAAGAGARTFRALLSTNSVSARSRIGAGPWLNANGVQVARSADALFNVGIPIGATRTRAMVDERGDPIPSRVHDVLTGTGDAGDLIIGANCQEWTSSEIFDTTVVGHTDGGGAQGEDPDQGWVAAHAAVDCSVAGLGADGGEGRFYCFAVD